MSKDDAKEFRFEAAVANLHLSEARRRAMRLFCTASTLFPDVWRAPLLNEQVLLDATEFALHARRLNELCGLRSVDFRLWP
jgi:hypothetical protein